MNADKNALIAMEKRFWQSMVDEDTDVALGMLAEPSFMVSPHGFMKFDHAGYRKMAEHGEQVIKRYELGDVDVTFVGDRTAVLSYQVEQVLAPRGKSGETVQHMADTSTWVKDGDAWKCIMHTETPISKS
jgi:hypothetical protein